MIPSVPADIAHVIARLAMAVLFSGLIGINREMRLKPAGLRTHALVGLGAALVSVVGALMNSTVLGDVATGGRLIQGLIAGIGFLGAGVILHSDDYKGVHGLTTAASVWLVATIGIAVGSGLWEAGAITCALALIVLAVGGPIDRRLHGQLPQGMNRPPDSDRS